MPVLPITDSTLIYGSNDAGKTMRKNDDRVNQVIEVASHNLFLSSHIVAGVEIFSAGDLEIHCSPIGFFLLDLSRCFPPEDFAVVWNHDVRISKESLENVPAELSSTSLWYRMLRPEFLQWLKAESKTGALSPDALSSWGKVDAIEHNSRVSKATELLLSTRVEEIVDFLFHVPLCSKPSLPLNLIFHKFGMNVRHMGIVFLMLLKRADSFPLYKWIIIQRLFFIELTSRTIKSLLREFCRIREVSGNSSKETKIAQFLQSMQELPSLGQEDSLRTLFLDRLVSKFGYSATNLVPFMAEPSFKAHWKEAILLAVETIGLLLTQKAIDNFRSSDELYAFTVSDFADFTVKIKNLCIFDRCSAISEIQRAEIAQKKYQERVELSFRANAIQYAGKSMISFGTPLDDFEIVVSQELVCLEHDFSAYELAQRMLYLLALCFLEFKTQTHVGKAKVVRHCRALFDLFLSQSREAAKDASDQKKKIGQEFLKSIKFFDSCGVFEDLTLKKLVLCRLRALAFASNEDILEDIQSGINVNDPSLEDLLVLSTWVNQGWSSKNEAVSSCRMKKKFSEQILTIKFKNASVWGFFDEEKELTAMDEKDDLKFLPTFEDISNLSSLEGFLTRGNFLFYKRFFEFFDSIGSLSSKLTSSANLSHLMRFWKAESPLELLIFLNLPGEFVRVSRSTHLPNLSSEQMVSLKLLSTLLSTVKDGISTSGVSFVSEKQQVETPYDFHFPNETFPN
jgi:hypothetical protein